MPHLELCRPIFPLIFQAIWELKAGAFDNFIDLLAKLNSMLYQAVDKKTSFELNFVANMKGSEEVEKYKKLFTSDGIPNFCLPLQYLSLIELLKIPLAAAINLPLDN